MRFFSKSFGGKGDSQRKCKKVIKKLSNELKNEGIKRNSIMRQIEAEIALLLKAGHHQKAYPMVEPLYKKMCKACAYHQMSIFCSQVSTHVPLFSNNSELPNQVKIAISSLIFASKMCGADLHELQLLQDIFRDRFGCEYINTDLELLPGNYVNIEMKENLCVDSISEDMKLRLMNSISEEYLKESIIQEDERKDIEYVETNRASECYLSESEEDFSDNSSESEDEFSDSTRDSIDSIEDIEMVEQRFQYLDSLRWLMAE